MEKMLKIKGLKDYIDAYYKKHGFACDWQDTNENESQYGINFVDDPEYIEADNEFLFDDWQDTFEEYGTGRKKVSFEIDEYVDHYVTDDITCVVKYIYETYYTCDGDKYTADDMWELVHSDDFSDEELKVAIKECYGMTDEEYEAWLKSDPYEFEHNGVKYAITDSNQYGNSFQAMIYDSEHYNAWVRTNVYGNTLAEVKEAIINREMEVDEDDD